MLSNSERLKYNKFTRGNEHTLEMFIPPNYVQSDYITGTFNITVNSGGWIGTRWYYRLDTIYDLKYWFDHMIADKPDPLCPYCNKHIRPFSNKISRGYLDTCGSDECLTLMHSITMNGHVNYDFYLQACSHLTGFLSKSQGSNKCYLYVGQRDGIYKFGATSNIFHKRSYGIYVRPIFESTPLRVAYFEYLLSIYFQSEWFNDFGEFKKVYRYIISKSILSDLPDEINWGLLVKVSETINTELNGRKID